MENPEQEKKAVIFTTKDTSDTFEIIWGKIKNLFKSNDDTVKEIIIGPKDTVRKQLCNCPKTKNRNYCDNIYEILQMIKTKTTNNSKILYQNLLSLNDNLLDIKGDNLRQIKKDTCRTYSNYIPLEEKKQIFNKLENVLKAFSNYDNRIKYYQGMNFIVAFFLFHCEEDIAFWLFVSLIEEYELRYLFMDNFPGLKVHIKRVEEILKNEYESIYDCFQKIGVKLDIFMIEWLFSLFSSLIPLELQMDFYKGFFSEGWIFFYKMCISAILNIKGKFSEEDEIYLALKNGKNGEDKKEDVIKKKWKNIIQKAYGLEIKTDVMKIK